MSKRVKKKQKNVKKLMVIGAKVKQLSEDVKKLAGELQKNLGSCDNSFDQLLSYSFVSVYLFYVKPIEVLSLYDLGRTNFYRRDIMLIHLNKFNDRLMDKLLSEYKHKFDRSIEMRKSYSILYKKYCRYCNKNLKYLPQHKQKLITKLKYSPGTRLPSTGELKVMRILNKLVKKHDLYYFYKYRWPFCKHKSVLEYDFFCILKFDHQVVLFNIEFDGGQHFLSNSKFYVDLDECHRRDVLKQYYLAQMNIHLLRLNDDDNNIYVSIVDFINQILDATTYVVVNPIEPNIDLFSDQKIHQGLKCFNQWHIDMRLKCSKQIDSFDREIESD